MRLVIAFALLATPALAATQGAWNSLDRDARTACERDVMRIAGKARVSGVTGKELGIGAARDEDRFNGLLLTGRTAGFKSDWLCLYDKRAKTAVAREISR